MSVEFCETASAVGIIAPSKRLTGTADSRFSVGRRNVSSGLMLWHNDGAWPQRI